MSTLFAAQLNEIAKSSNDELNLRAQKEAHSQSLTFEQQIAGSQDFGTLYQICLEGFEDLCRLDTRFVGFSHSIFSPQSQSQERAQMTKEQNAKLDTVLESFLGLVGARLLLRSAVKAVEWLIRRFRVHEYNIASLLFTFLPYHRAPVFQNLLSILSAPVPSTFKFLGPYLQSLTSPPRHAIVYSATNNDGFFTAFNEYIVQLCRQDSQHQQLLSFWAAVCVEAVGARLEQAKSGRREIQRQREEDILTKILPVLNDGLSLLNSAELVVACYTISIVLTTKATLASKVLDRLMEAVAGSFNLHTSTAGMICLAIMVERREDHYLPRKVVSAIQKIPEVDRLLQELGGQYDTGPMILGIVKSCLSASGRKNFESKLNFVKQLLQNNCVPYNALGPVATVILRAAEIVSNDANASVSRSLFRDLIDILKNHDHQSSGALTEIISTPIDVDRLEATLQMTIHTNGHVSPPEDTQIAETPNFEAEDAFTTASMNIPTGLSGGISFLSDGYLQLYSQVSGLYHLALPHKDLLQRFRDLPIFKHRSNLKDPTYLSFLCRVLVEDRSDAARVAAMESITLAIPSKSNSIDLQVILPYTLIALADPVDQVRKTASRIIMAASSLEPTKLETTDLAELVLYAPGDQVEKALVLSSSDVARIIRKVVLPVLEECVLDPNQIQRALESALKGSSSTTRVNDRLESIEIKKALRSALFGFLIDQILRTPLWSVKLALLKCLQSVHRVGSRYKSDELLPLIHSWASETRQKKIVETEGLKVDGAEWQIATIISASDRQPVEKVLSIFDLETLPRTDFVDAINRHMIEIWPLFKHDIRDAASDSLFDGALSLGGDNAGISRFCRDLLRAVSLTTEKLSALLERVYVSAPERQENPPPLKKRRTVQYNSSKESDKNTQEILSYVDRLSLVLEVVHDSEPEHRPDVLKALFKTLGSIHRLKQQYGSEMGYILNLTLGSILAIVKYARTSTALQLDSSAVRIDQIIDCVRLCENQQVQNTALLVMANIARLAPDTVLHNVMPIFTFIGSNTSRKDDEYSAHVIDQTIDHVIPPLIQSLRDQKKDVLAGATELLSSFTAAFEHIPSHRRARLFDTLISKLGAKEFLFAAFALLGTRDMQTSDKYSFVSLMASNFPLDVQFASLRKLLTLISDALANDPDQAQTILNMKQMDAKERHKTVNALMRMLPALLSQRTIGAQMNESLRGDPVNASNTREVFAATLEQLIALGAFSQDQQDFAEAITATVDSLLGLPSLPELILIATKLLSYSDDQLRQKILRLVEKRMTIETATDAITQSAAIGFLEPLTTVLNVSSDNLLKHAAVTCVDRIAESAGFSLLLSIISTLPWMISEDNVASILELSSESAGLDLGDESEQARMEVLQALAGKIDFHMIVAATRRSWSVIASNGVNALRESSILLSNSIDSCSKGVVVRDCEPLLEQFLLALDLRRFHLIESTEDSYTEQEIDDFEAEQHAVFLKMIYKLNDSTFRPLFQHLVEWSSQDSDAMHSISAGKEKLHRQTSIFKLLAHLFSTLKSLVTSYAGSILQPAIGVLEDTLSSNNEGKSVELDPSAHTLWTSTLSMLRPLFEHDQDAYFSTPSHFSALTGPLISQLRLAGTNASYNAGVKTHVISSIVSLAHAVSSTPSHHQSLNRAICDLRHDPRKEVRLASVRCQAALTNELAEEWLENVNAEMMIYVNEMLEDDDEEVEREVRRWVGKVQEVLGEEIGV
ncbi:MAG: hypothetical protein Q9160_007872 [Pyrenula sp. 1 TL-2023]